jgi:hypothetical protein
MFRLLSEWNQEVALQPLKYLLSAMLLKQGKLTARMIVKILSPKGIDPSKGSDLRLISNRFAPLSAVTPPVAQCLLACDNALQVP